MSSGNNSPTVFPQRNHDHSHCLEDALAAAERRCAASGGRLTELRRRVLELVWQSHEPVKAYELMEQLRRERSGVAPPTVYRALDFLRAEGLIHRIESLNAFVGCGEPSEAHQGQFLICDRCGGAAEVNDPEIDQLLAAKAARLGFRLARATVELRGVCPRCAGEKPREGAP